ncbi:nuclear transport factor 2 family protein [Candidatus Bipolaricaulota bacterium]|nr:nuclear transport factor 2 family protein [Candidatus Bipolaricaulota bacterium]
MHQQRETRDEKRVRQVLEDVYVRDMYMKESREALSREFDAVFHMLVPELDGRDNEPVALRWDGLDELRSNHPKAVFPETRFEFPLVDVVGNAAVARVDVFHGDVHVYSDFVSLYRVQGQWRLVSKVFHAHLMGQPQSTLG